MKLSWVIVYVPDVAASVAFYEEAFGLERRFVHESGTYGEMQTGETTLAFASNELADGNTGGLGVRPNVRGEPPAGVEIALTTDDVAGALDRAVAAGAEHLTGPETKPWGQTVAWVRDRDGVLVEIATPIPA